jgi:signal transduction histidine kinase
VAVPRRDTAGFDQTKKMVPVGWLAIERRVEQLGGELEIHSQPEGGPGVTVRSTTKCLMSETIRILIADDHAVVRKGRR